MMLSRDITAFDLDQEPASVREAYGDGQFGAGCLLARRLVEHGVTFVEVTPERLGHASDNFDSDRELCGQLDQPYAQLIRDLKQRGLLDNTLVIWMGEFGRTPRINPRAGRDHFPQAFNVALAGAGVQRRPGHRPREQRRHRGQRPPVTVPDLFRTVCTALDIDPDHENMSPIGRPMTIVDGGEVVEEVFG